MNQKNFVQDKWTILVSKMVHLHNSGTFKKFCWMKGTNSYMKILLVVFWEKKFIWGNLIFLAFRPFFTVWLGMVKLSQVTVNWYHFSVFRESGKTPVLRDAGLWFRQMLACDFDKIIWLYPLIEIIFLSSYIFIMLLWTLCG